MERQSIKYPKYGSFQIYTTNEILKHRAISFLRKEPTTLDWLQSLDADSIFIDIGANIGIYSIPSALFHVKKVIAIEPEINNYCMLLNNIELNKLDGENIEALPLAISTEFANRSTRLYLTNEEAGNSCHQVGRNQNHLLEKTESSKRKFRSTYCISLASVVKQAAEYHEGPIHIKIDVDGNEEDVCQSLFDDKIIHRISSLQVELNRRIASHQRLIDRFASAGYFFCEEQVEKSRRKAGHFQGFAEVVFRRDFSNQCIKHLPQSFVKTLGKNFNLTRGERTILPINLSFLTLAESIPVPLSRHPSSYALKNSFDEILCAKAFHQVAHLTLSCDGKSTEFLKEDGTKSANNLRREIHFSAIEKIAPKYIDQLIDQVTSPIFISKLSEIVEHAAQFTYSTDYLKRNFLNAMNEKLQGKHLICRIRHFLDLQGYSLDSHNDSPDTFCALIAPLTPYSTTTSIINGGIFDREFNRQPDKNNSFDSAFERGVSYDAQTCTNTYIKYTKSLDANTFCHQTPYTLQRPELRPGEMFVLPNLRSWTFGNIDNNQEQQSFEHIFKFLGHGVLPCVREPYRPVLLIDYIFSNPEITGISNDSQKLIDIGNALQILTKY